MKDLFLFSLKSNNLQKQSLKCTLTVKMSWCNKWKIDAMKNMWIVVLLIGIVTMLISAPLGVPSQRFLLQKQQVETHKEKAIGATLRKYYNSESYIVDVRIDIKTVDNIREVKRVDTTISQLPGLPTIPESFRNSSEGMYDTLIEQSYDMGTTQVTIIVDTSYSFDDFGFILETVRIVANLDESAGDNVVITKKLFPRTNRAIFQAPPLLSEIIDDSVEIETPLPVEKKSYLWHIVIGLAVILFVFYIFFRKMIEAIANSKTDDSDIREALTTVIQKVDSMQRPVVEPDEKRELRKLQAFLVDSFLSKPEAASTVFKNWIDEDSEIGVQNTATLISSTDPDLFDSITSEFSSIEQKSVSWHITQNDPVDIATQLKLLKTYKKDFSNITKELSDNSVTDIFNFLKQLTDEQVKHLVQNEEDGIKAIIIAQLSSAKASMLLQNFETAQRTTILRYIGNLSQIPMGSYKKLASRLAKRALELGNMKYVVSDGVERILDLLFSLPLSEQESYISSLAEADLTLVQKIRRFFVSYSELSTIPTDLLRTILLGVDQDQLVLALTGENEEITQKMLAVLPERMQQMVVSSVAAKRNAPLSDIENARIALIKFAHLELKKRGGREV